MLVHLFTVMFLNCLVTRSKRLISCIGLRKLLISLLRMKELSITMTGSGGSLLSFLAMLHGKISLPVPRTLLLLRTSQSLLLLRASQSLLLLRASQMKLFNYLALAVLWLIEILLLIVLLCVTMH